ncbi:hypothetical protein OG705_29185 [Streptomyces sp. NBC_00838]|uniref:hypothetical protein n=1 Tax=Streptomyces sp. NBC_00838 TaxID=2903680 RepID=UPI00386762EC|nr:hypothetical protein OG705_29185 [Streptomyces sp. NBC_00838]
MPVDPLTPEHENAIRSDLAAVPAPPWRWIGNRGAGGPQLVTDHSGRQYLLRAAKPVDGRGDELLDPAGDYPIYGDLQFRDQREGEKYSLMRNGNELGIGRTSCNPDNLVGVDNAVANWLMKSAAHAAALLAELDRVRESRAGMTRANADWLEGIGQDHAAEMLRHSLDMDAEIAATEEKDSTTTVPPATADFFHPGHTYADTEVEWQFRCDTVTTHPAGSDRTALGWRYFKGQWEPYAYGEDEWELHQLVGHTQVRDTPAAPEPVLTARQERLLAHMRAASRSVWSTGPVEDLYRAWRVRTPRDEARRDLAQLAELGHLTRHGDDTGRRYRLNTRKDGVV